MADKGPLKYQDIPFVIDGTVKIVKSVTKQTTCKDVISKLPNMQFPLAIFESVNGVEKELPGKTKLLKVWRAHGPSNKVVFVVRKSLTAVTKRNKYGLFSEKKTPKFVSKRKTTKETKESLKNVSDLAFYVRYQKSKVQSMKRKLDALNDESEAVGSKIMKKFISTSSMDSMDRFLAKADLDKMANFLSFCGGVTEEKLRQPKLPRSKLDQSIHVAKREMEKTEMEEMNRNIIRSGLNSMKLGFKQKFMSKDKVTKRTTSAGTIGSTDTGYHSAHSEEIDSKKTDRCVHSEKQVSGFPKRHTFIDTDNDGGPRHSTPVIARTFMKRNENDQTCSNLTFDENEGKRVILQKFIADQEATSRECDSRASVGYYGHFLQDEVNCRRQNVRQSLPAFTSQKERCRFFWDIYCDSDSDSSCMSDDSDIWNTSQLDNAFIDQSKSKLSESDTVTPKNRTLRRESAISNLTKFSLRPQAINIDDSDDSFNYSFDCTFPRMDEDKSVDFTCCFSNDFSNQDDDVKTVSIDGEIGVNVTNELLKDIIDSDDSFADSDEGLGSMSSGSVSDVLYI